MNSEKGHEQEQASECSNSQYLMLAAPTSMEQEEHGQQAAETAATTTHSHDLPPLPPQLYIQSFDPAPVTPSELYACSFSDVNGPACHHVLQQVAESGVNATDAAAGPIGLKLTINAPFIELIHRARDALAAAVSDDQYLTGMPGQHISPTSTTLPQHTGSNQACGTAILDDQFMGGILAESSSLVAGHLSNMISTDPITSTPHQGCNPTLCRLFHTGGTIFGTNNNPTHGSPIQAGGGVVTDLCTSELGKRYHGGAAKGSENLIQEDHPTNTNTKKRRVGRPKGSSSKITAREPKGPNAIQLTAKSIQIGEWKKINETGCDLIAKCYFGHKKLIWEILCHQTKLKNRMEVDWKHILSMKISLLPKDEVMLRVELSRPPGFSRETEVTTNKHSSWGACSDFTSGHALSYRIHDLVFKSQLFSDSFKQILEKSQELRELYEKPFPTMASSRFETNNSATDTPVQPGDSNLAMQLIDQPSPCSHSFQSMAEPFVNIQGDVYQSSSDDPLSYQVSYVAAAIQSNLTAQATSVASEDDPLPIQDPYVPPFIQNHLSPPLI